MLRITSQFTKTFRIVFGTGFVRFLKTFFLKRNSPRPVPFFVIILMAQNLCTDLS